MNQEETHSEFGTLERIILIRHGEAEPYGVSDHQRALTLRGRAQLQLTLQHLQYALSDVQDASSSVWVSDARRTQETWNELNSLAPELNQLPVNVLSRLYLASARSLYHDLLEEGLTSSTQILLMIGHNPGLSELVNELIPNTWCALQTGELIILKYVNGCWIKETL